MNGELLLNYLEQLEGNNTKEWFHANKALYREAEAEFVSFIGELLVELRKNDPSIPLMEPKTLTFKLQRDTRFSHDKSPYMPAFRAHISSRGKLPIPVGYYMMLRPGGRSFLGGGLFTDVFRDATSMVRDFIAGHGEEWMRILEEPDFREQFIVKGTSLKKVPQGYDQGHPWAAYLKNKSWYLEVPVPDAQVIEEGFLDQAVGIFRKMQPFNGLLNRALEGFQMSER